MTRLLLLTSECPPWNLGGVGRYVQETVPLLRTAMDVDVFVVPTYQHLDRKLEAPGDWKVQVGSACLQAALTGVSDAADLAPLHQAAMQLADEWASTRSEVPSMIYVQDYALAPLAAELARRHACRVVAACHLPVFAGFTYFDRPIRDAVHQVLEAQLIQCAEAVVVPSRFAAHVLAMTHNIADKVVVAPLGVTRQAAPTPIPCGPPRLLTVGRPTEQKGHHFLLQALEQLWESGHEVELTIVTGASDNSRLARLISQSPVRAHVELHGHIAPDALWDVIDEHHLVVCASLYETFGLSVLEAMACARPVIGFDLPALNELWGPLLAPQCRVPIARPDLLARRLAQALESPGQLERLGNAGRERSTSFTWLNHVAQLKTLLA